MSFFLAFSLTLLLSSNQVLAAQNNSASETPETLQYHLTNWLNELELLLKNQRVDLADLRKQERDISELKIYERIPLQRKIPELKSEAKLIGTQFGIELFDLEVKSFSPAGNPPPSQIFSDSPRFQFTPEQLTETIHFVMTVQGSRSDLNRWIANWKDQQLRLMELDSPKYSKPISEIKSQGSKSIWKINARAFDFRETHFPHVRSRNPDNYLMQHNINQPALIRLSQQIKALIPRASPLYQIRGQFLLNDARISFFLSKAS